MGFRTLGYAAVSVFGLEIAGFKAWGTVERLLSDIGVTELAELRKTLRTPNPEREIPQP